jgi:hypothetical protein
MTDELLAAMIKESGDAVSRCRTYGEFLAAAPGSTG